MSCRLSLAQGMAQNTAYALLRFLPWVLPLYVVRFQVGKLPTTLLEVWLLLLFVFFSFGFGLRGWSEGFRRLRMWRLPILAWFLASAFAVFISPVPVAGLGLWRAYVLEPLLLFCALPLLLPDAVFVKKFEQQIFLSLILWFMWALIQFLTGYGIPHPWDVSILAGRRATGPWPFPNALALYMAPLGAYAFVRWMQERKNRYALFAWIVAAGSVVLAKSEGGMLALGIVLWITLFFQKSLRKWVLGATVLFLVVAMAIPIMRTTLVREFTFQGWSGQVRLFQWRETWHMLSDHWFLGAGLAAYPTVFAPYHLAKAIEIFQYPHNIVLNFWTETGLLGLLVFLWVCVTWVWQGRRVWWRAAPFIVIFIHGIVDVPYFKNDLAIVFWLLAFLSTLP